MKKQKDYLILYDKLRTMHTSPHTIMIMMYRIYTAAFIRTTTITYILQRFMTTIVPVIHYCGESAEGKQQQGEENELQKKSRIFWKRTCGVIFRH